MLRTLLRFLLLLLLAGLSGMALWLLMHRTETIHLIRQALQEETPTHIHAVTFSPPPPLHTVATQPPPSSTFVTPASLVLAEVRFNVQTAQQLLFLGRDPAVVLDLLQQADQMSIPENTTAWLSFRRALATDILHVQSLKNSDRLGTYLQLSTLRRQLEQTDMQLAPASASALTDISATSGTAPGSVLSGDPDWKNVLQDGLQQFRQLIQIRRVPAQSILLPDRQQLAALKQHLESLLDEATWAWLHEEPVVYHQALSDTSLTLEHYALCIDPTALRLFEQQLLQLNQRQPPVEQKNPMLDSTLTALQHLENSSGVQP